MSEPGDKITKRFRVPEATDEDWNLITNPGMKAVLGAVVGKQKMNGRMSIGAILAALLAAASYFGIKPPWQTAADAAAELEKIRAEESAEHKEMRQEVKADIQTLTEKIDNLPSRVMREMRRR